MVQDIVLLFQSFKLTARRGCGIDAETRLFYAHIARIRSNWGRQVPVFVMASILVVQ
jgi:hypothetical protein